MLDISRMRGACVQYSALLNVGARQVRALQLYYIDDVMVMNIIKMVKNLPDQLKILPPSLLWDTEVIPY